jgi:uracil-DNA glycosylase
MTPSLWELCPLRAPCWRAVLEAALASDPPLGPRLAGFLAARRERLLPPAHQVFAALEATPLARVQVAILGQDPYPTPGDAHGLSFSVQRRHPLPRSLANILSEVARDTGSRPPGGDLSGWASSGVLLLNRLLTFERPREGAAAKPHQGIGWETVGQALLLALLQRRAPLVVLAWGRHAGAAMAECLPALGGAGLDGVDGQVLVLRATHPSPLSCRRPAQGMPAFLGCGHFSAANRFLRERGAAGVDWHASAPG